ncbi:MAG: HlyC/CorC family transporter [Coriobacteriia bacterium]|nr:HlyC/CorC family transporter [Coriobacteriia bacterium]
MALIFGVALVASAAFASSTVTAVGLVPRGRTRRLVESDRPGAHALERLQDQPSRLSASAALILGAAYAGVSASTAWVIKASYPPLPFAVAAALGWAAGALIVYTLGEALPRTLAVQNPERVALAFSPGMRRAARAVEPLAALMAGPWRGLMRLTGGAGAGVPPWSDTDEYRDAVNGDGEEAEREEAEEALRDAVADFTSKIVREVMVPRTDMASLPDTAGAQEALDLIETAGYSRLPVYHETLDDIRGVLYAKDLLLCVGRRCEDVDLTSIARPAYFVPETKPVEELLLEMRSRPHIAIVADEYGGTAGLVTIEDLLEEIVGEIFDEYDRQEQLVVDLGEGRFLVDARVPVDEVNERFGTAVDTEADSVGGLVTELAGRIPETGEAFEVEGLRLVVDEREGTRIRRLVVEPAGGRGGEETDR